MENNNLSKKENIIQAIKFLLFSISAGVIQILSFTLMFELLNIKEWVSHLVALILSVLWNFTLNRKFTFKSANNVKIAMLKIACFYIVFTPTTTWLMDYLTSLGVNAFLVEAGTMVLNFILEFLYSKYFVYKDSINTNIKKNN